MIWAVYKKNAMEDGFLDVVQSNTAEEAIQFVIDNYEVYCDSDDDFEENIPELIALKYL